MKPRYSTWIRSSRIVLFWCLGAGTVAAALALALVWPPLVWGALLALPFLYIATVISLTAWQFSDRGGRYQDRIHRRLREAVGTARSVLDVGCGSGRLLLGIAKATPGEHVGLDFWGDDWEYSQSQCETNARIEGVTGVQFVRGSASALPFSDATFDAVVSCLTFHEVGDAADKTDSLAEALRVLKPGGRFVFFDLFDDSAFYPRQGAVEDRIKRSGGRVERSQRLADLEALPFPLGGPRVLKFARLIVGRRDAR